MLDVDPWTLNESDQEDKETNRGLHDMACNCTIDDAKNITDKQQAFSTF